MKAGFSSIVITPELENRKKPLQLGGFSPREYCTGVHDDIFIRAVYMEGKEDDISTHVLMMVGDIIAVDKNMANIVKKQIAKKIPILTKNIMISATHTHHGPDYKGNFLVGGPLAVVKGFLFPKPQTKELIRLGKKIFNCAIEAYNSRKNATMGITQTSIPESERVMMNRRDPFKPERAQYPVTVMKFCSAEESNKGQLIGAVLNYSCHGTVLPRYNYEITADYVGYVIKALEASFPDLKGNFVYFNGPCGEINPLTSELKEKMQKVSSKEELSNDDIYDQRGTWEDAQNMGETIAGAALNVLNDISCNDSNKFAVTEKNVRIAVKDYKYGSDLNSALRQIQYSLKRIFFTLFAKIGIFKTSILLDTEHLSENYVDAYIQAIDLGNTIIYTIPAEFFLELAKEILKYSRNEFPEKQAFVIELANHDVGYLYTIQAYTEGGYESGFSLTPMGGRYLTMRFKRLIDELKANNLG